MEIRLPYLQSEFSGTVSGEGDALLVCFHGFGESAAHFDCMEAALGQTFTIVALNMPFHGTTVWNEGREMERADLEAIVKKILEKFGKQTFSLMGYSMGGRLVLCLLEAMPAQIEHVILLAPDGLRNNPWHMFVTQSRLGNRLFLYNTHHPALFFGLLKIGKRWKLLNESVYKFALHRMDKPEKRRLVYDVWTNLRNMMPNRRHCKQLIRRYNIDMLMLFGRFDRVIPPVLGKRFADGSFPCKIVVLDRGHQLLSESAGYIIRNNLRN